jgi:hypothetical protein
MILSDSDTLQPPENMGKEQEIENGGSAVPAPVNSCSRFVATDCDRRHTDDVEMNLRPPTDSDTIITNTSTAEVGVANVKLSSSSVMSSLSSATLLTVTRTGIQGQDRQDCDCEMSQSDLSETEGCGDGRIIFADEVGAAGALSQTFQHKISTAAFAIGLGLCETERREYVGRMSTERIIQFEQDLGHVLVSTKCAASAIPMVGPDNIIDSLPGSDIDNMNNIMPIAEFVITSINDATNESNDLPIVSSVRSDAEPEEQGPSPKVARLQPEENSDENFYRPSSNLKSSPVSMDMMEDEPAGFENDINRLSAHNPATEDPEIRENFMTVLSPSQSSSIGSLSTQSPSTGSPYCCRDSASMIEDCAEPEQILCYPTFEELQQSYNLDDDSSESMAVLNEVILQNDDLTPQSPEDLMDKRSPFPPQYVKQDSQPGLPLQM